MRKVTLIYQQTYHIRNFKPTDLTFVTEINRSCLPENYTSGFFMDIYQNCPEGFLIAEMNSHIIGYSMVRIELGFSEFNRMKIVRKAHLVSIAIIGPYRRLGVAFSLLTRTLKVLYSRGIKECFLEVRNTNSAGIALYEKMGFKGMRTLPSYYQDGADALLMAKQLS